MKKLLFFCHFLLWIASYGPEGSFLLIFWARDDLVKVLWKWDTWKCQTNLPSLLKEASLYEKEKDKNIFKIFRSRKSDGKIVAGTKMKKRFLSGIRSDTLELWESLDIKCIVLEAPSYPCSTLTGQKGEAESNWATVCKFVFHSAASLETIGEQYFPKMPFSLILSLLHSCDQFLHCNLILWSKVKEFHLNIPSQKLNCMSFTCLLYYYPTIFWQGNSK